MNISRRGFLGAILAAGTAPFVVRAGSLMAVRVPETGIVVIDDEDELDDFYQGFWSPPEKDPFDQRGDDMPVEMCRQIGERMKLVQIMIAGGVLHGSEVA